ncbi:hypothetical protein [Antarcticibacterium sp. 1MA-6-2]|uniref:hypothetical protein n=1 Tax=Antarcticibacterium sp. 1MA-6-2 TaxID=2908210 RepID=UPI002882E9AB|nr:hypothetical protein [Antarcticibacterium sp. 1MA-6-2]
MLSKGSEVAGPLENLTYNGKNIPVKYFDKQGNEVSRPDFNKAVDPSVTTESIFKNYIKAIGGKEAVEDVESVLMKAEASIQGQQLSLETRNTKDGKSSQIIAMGGNIISKNIYNGESGFVVAQGQKMPYNDEQLNAAKAESNPFPELNSPNAKLRGIEQVNGKDAYAVAFDENTVVYYDVETGLKVQAVKTVSQGGQTMTVPTNFSNYQAVKGVKFPYTITQSFGPQSFEFNVTSIQINEGVSAEDFIE